MTTTTEPTREFNGIEIPAAGRWVIDPGHAEVAFIGRHFMLTKVRGRFTGIDGVIDIGDDPSDSTVVVDIDMASVDSGDRSRDDHLRSPDLFDVEAHPTASFRSTRVAIDGRSGTMHGSLTIRDVTNAVSLDIDYVGFARDPWDNERAVFSAKGRIDRRDWGLTWNMKLDTGGMLVSQEIDIEIEVEAIRG